VKVKKSKSKDKVWRAAEAALAAAQQMPVGPARVAALKDAGQLRLKADERRLRKEQFDRDKTQ
jgi:serine/threonine protein kinase HipA of HipAB toxin-antitoxin module